jgi:OPT family oligopeptide transporter
MDTTSLSGFGERQLTPRAAIVGVFVGGLMCFSNLYFGLQTGWVTMGSLQSTILGFGVFKLLRPYLDREFGPLENVVLQTVAVATATMPLAGGFVGIIPALAMLTPEQGGPITFTFGQLCWWSAAIAFFGVFAAVPLRRQTILREKLKFPSGTATAEIIKVLHGVNDGQQSSQPVTRTSSSLEMEPLVSADPDPGSPEYLDPKSPRSTNGVGHGGAPGGAAAAMEAHEWRVLFGSFLLSAAYTLSSHFLPILKNLPVMSWLGFPVATAWFWSLQPSLSYVGQGLIMGPRT